MILLFFFYLMNFTNLMVAKNSQISITRNIINIFLEPFSRPYVLNNLEIKLFPAQHLKIILTIYTCTDGIRRLG